ncbi:DUF4832 domain-containing protein, partial [Noviherbaspirillum sp. CPCC 100848]
CDGNLSASQLQGWRTSEGMTMAVCSVGLGSFINSAISQAKLDQFNNNMNAFRTAGLKAIVRFSYSSDTSGTDANLTRIRAHMDQLKPYLEKHKDVIAVVHAGFIGGWGEWAYSQNFGNLGSLSSQNWADRKAVADKMLEVTPVERMVQLRVPDFKIRFAGSTPLSASEAYTGTAKARLAHHNDCFLASSNDWGTYTNTATEYPFLQAETTHLAMGGETCNYAPPRSDCPTALKELAMFHYSYLSNGYHQTVLNAFKNQGCYEEIKQRLGYRYVLQNGSYSTSAKPGGSMAVNFTVQNKGWASNYNTRDVELVLRNTSTGGLYRFKLNADPRKWLPGQNVTVSQNVTLPA